MINSQIIKEYALEYGASLVGIGDIKHFENAPLQRDPKQILPNARNIIGMAFRVPRSLYKAMNNKSQFFNYTSLGVKFIDEELAEIILLKMARLIENEGYEACLQRNVSNLRIKGDKTTNPELIDTYELQYAEAVAPDRATPDVILDFKEAARICNLGMVGDSGNVISPKLGPFVRFAFIVTNAPLDCDEPFAKTLCDSCGECMNACPGHAISEKGVNSWQCAVYYRGAHKSNPFMKDDFLADNPNREAIINGDMEFDSESARALYNELDFLPSKATGYIPCLCGKSCDTVCYKHLKKNGIL